MKLIETKLINQEECLVSTHLPWPCYHGKVRDCYQLKDKLLLVSTDRISAFDRILGVIPYKGQVLTQLSAWWFEKTQEIIANHFIKLITPNSMLVKCCQPLPIEVVVRGYITGTTQTSLWTLYQQGQREFAGYRLPEHLSKNQPLATPIITPTTKDIHDRPLSRLELNTLPFLQAGEWEMIEKTALALYQFANQLLAPTGLILADTKYEFGRDKNGKIILIDELHTPDSSRYWSLENLKKSLANQLEPESFDKEILRLWYKKHTNPYQDSELPEPPLELIQTVSAKYQQLYQLITQQIFLKEPASCVESLASSLNKL